jgi:hypothetical protein
MKNGVNFVARLGVVLRLHGTKESSSTHLLPNFFKPILDSRLEPLQHHAIGTLDLAVSSRVGDCGPVHTDVMPITEV